MAFGVHKYYKLFHEELKDFWEVYSINLYSEGWLASYGAIRALIRPNDYVIIDEFSHNSIVEGCKLSTQNIKVVSHLNLE